MNCGYALEMVVDLCARHKERRPGKDLGRAAGSKPAARVSVGHDECVAHASSSPCVAHNPRVEYDTATHSHSPPWQAPSPPPPPPAQTYHPLRGRLSSPGMPVGAVGLWGCGAVGLLERVFGGGHATRTNRQVGAWRHRTGPSTV